MAKVAFLGLGVMGYPMAGHLKNKGGHEVTVYNRTAAKAEQWVKQHGGKSAPTPKAAAEGQDFVMACVGNDNDLREVTLGSNGAFAGMGKGKVFVDWSQNHRRKTTIAVYSLRARERPTVSTPVTWEEVEYAARKEDADSLVFEAKDVLKRIERDGDLFEPVLMLKQALPQL